MAYKAPGPRGIAAALPKVTRAVFKRQGFTKSDVLTNWKSIVGDDLARRCCPEKLIWPGRGTDGATLRVRVASGWAPKMQHLEPTLVERINTYFGYRAVARLKLVQGAVRVIEPRAPRRTRALTDAEDTLLEQRLSAIRDPDLAEAMRGLGRQVMAGGADNSGERN